MAGRKEERREFKRAYKGTGADKLLTDWNHRATYTLANLIKNDHKFLEDVEAVRADTKLSDKEKVFWVINEYGLQYSVTELTHTHFLRYK
jgi:hypothetical protein